MYACCGCPPVTRPSLLDPYGPVALSESSRKRVGFVTDLQGADEGSVDSRRATPPELGGYISTLLFRCLKPNALSQNLQLSLGSNTIYGFSWKPHPGVE